MNISKFGREIKILFQPVHDIESGMIKGFEALARGPAGPLHLPTNFFRAAARENMVEALEMQCFRLAVKESFSLPGMIFINFSPSTVTRYHREILNILSKNLRDRAVIELVEYALPEKVRYELIGVLGELRHGGFKIALDDVGNGDRDFSDICELPADIMKIDRRLIQGLSKQRYGNAPRYQIILNALVALAQKLKMSIIAEGIETEKQFCGVKSAGINLAQGFYLSKPQPALFWLQEKLKGDVQNAGGR